MSGALLILAILHFIFYFPSNRRKSHLASGGADLFMIWLLLCTGEYSVFGNYWVDCLGPQVARPLAFFCLCFFITLFQYLHIARAKSRVKNQYFFIVSLALLLVLVILFFLLPVEHYYVLRVTMSVVQMLVHVIVFKQIISAKKNGDTNANTLLKTFTLFVLFTIVAFCFDYKSHPLSFLDYLFLFALMFWLDINVVKNSGLFIKADSSNDIWKGNLNRQIEELQNSNQSKDKFLSIIAHDLKNPIASIKMLADIYTSEAQEANSRHQMDLAETLSDSIDSIYKLLDNLLMWSRTQNDTIKFNPGILEIDAVVEQLKHAVNSVCNAKGIGLRVFVRGELTIYADQNMLQTILRNLVTNAVKFSYPDNFIDLTFDSDPSGYIIKVSDNGVGMSKEVLLNLFQIDKISSTSGTQKEQGTGLGLILCNEFVHRHGGRIEVSSEEGFGSTFVIHLPRK